jgi:hypothetical protein
VSNANLQSFDEVRLVAGKIPPNSLRSDLTETIDLSGILTRDLTQSGSFDALNNKGSSFHRLLQALPMPALLLDGDQRVIFSNQAVTRINGEDKDLNGIFLAALFRPQSVARAVSGLLGGCRT